MRKKHQPTRTTPSAPRPRAGRLALARTCTLAEAQGLKTSLAGLLRNVNPVTIAVDAVERIDTASLQLLAAFARERRSASLEVRWSGQSAAFGEAVRLLGIEGLLAPASAG